MDDYRARRRWLKENGLEPDLEAIRAWLKLSLEDLTFDRADILTVKWTRGRAAPGSNWTREDELRGWIVASTNDPVAWEGCRRLLEELDYDAVPTDLKIWAIDAAAKRIEEPTRPHGQHASDHTWRNARIAQAVETCWGAGLTFNDACRLVAEVSGTPGWEQVGDIYKKNRKTGNVFDGITIRIAATRPRGA